ncbi:MAG: hypothetical protein QOH70_4023 [Blastocatellia bacterium]|jgi:hypothetical protein|nr:hypothetical protein [Blastocatellia bacterium]
MPEPSTNEQFQKVLDVSERQIKENKILLRFGPTGKLRVVIDEASLKVALTDSGMDETTFSQIFHGEVAPPLEAVIQNKAEQFPQLPSPFTADVSGEILEARKRILGEHVALVEKRLFTSELRARFLLKVSSKHPRLRYSSWEVATKRQLSTKEELQNYPYATLKLETLDPERNLGFFSFLALEVGNVSSIAFDCDENDLDDLIQLLKDAKAALQASRKGT